MGIILISTRIITVALLVLLSVNVSSACRALYPTDGHGAARSLFPTGGYGGFGGHLGAFLGGKGEGYGGFPDSFGGSGDFPVGFGVHNVGIKDQVASNSKRDVVLPTTTMTTETDTDKAAAIKNKDGKKQSEGNFNVGHKDKNKIEQKGTCGTEGCSAPSPKPLLFPGGDGFEGGYGGFPGSYGGYGCGYGCVKYEGPTKEGDKIHG